jgi:ferric iron reductase protein FhuF
MGMAPNSQPLSFTPDEWTYMTEHLRVTTTSSSDRNYSIASSDLIDESKCLRYIEGLAGIYNSPSLLFTASQFSKRYAYLLVSPSLYAMTMFDKGLDLPLDCCHVESGYLKGAWIPNIRLEQIRVNEHVKSDRDEWRDAVIQRIFAGHLAKVWKTLSKVAGVSKAILWENTAIYVFALYENRMAKETANRNKTQVQEDFNYLVGSAPGALFGEKKNPLAQYYGPRFFSSADQPARIRKTCCYRYKLSPENPDHCLTCPLGKRE